MDWKEHEIAATEYDVQWWKNVIENLFRRDKEGLSLTNTNEPSNFEGRFKQAKEGLARAEAKLAKLREQA